MCNGRPNILSMNDIADRVGIRPDSVRRLKRWGELPPPDYTIDGKELWLERTVECWVRARYDEADRE